MDFSKSLSALANTSASSTPMNTAPDVNRYSNLNSQNYGQSSDLYPSAPAPTQATQPGGLGVVTTPFGGSTRGEGFHPGIDIANTIGTQIPAFTSGKVVEITTGKKQGDKAFGNYIVIQDDNGNKWRYSHLKDEYVRIGQSVPQGTPIATMGNSGNTYSESGGTGSHLDLRIINAYNKYVDPTRYVSSYLTPNR